MSGPPRPQMHVNPVFPEYFADPFVWKTGGRYYAIGTGPQEASGERTDLVFPILMSTDFFHWRHVASGLIPPDPALGSNFWAPAVAEQDGVFHLYYSVGHGDKHHQMRVATSRDPLGPYLDTGASLLPLQEVPFAIDPHPFMDDDGQWYLFYATDFLGNDVNLRAGTALKAARMAGMLRLADAGKVILRARFDWQRFENPRTMYGREFDWHTLEGPCLIKHQGKYFCFYSGGRWENETYGVDFATANSVLGPYSDAGGEKGPRILKTIPDHLVGPGHNSIIRGPDNLTDYLVYHAWDATMTARRMFISPLDWTPAGPCPVGH